MKADRRAVLNISRRCQGTSSVVVDVTVASGQNSIKIAIPSNTPRLIFPGVVVKNGVLLRIKDVRSGIEHHTGRVGDGTKGRVPGDGAVVHSNRKPPS